MILVMGDSKFPAPFISKVKDVFLISQICEKCTQYITFI